MSGINHNKATVSNKKPGVTLAELAIYLALAAIVIAGAVSAYNVAFSGVDKTEVRTDVVAIAAAAKAYRAENSLSSYFDSTNPNGNLCDADSNPMTDPVPCDVGTAVSEGEWSIYGNLLPQRLHDGTESQVSYLLQDDGDLEVTDDSTGTNTLTPEACAELVTYFQNTAGSSAVTTGTDCAAGTMAINLSLL